METKIQPQTAENTLTQIQDINEDSYWTKEFDIPTDQVKKPNASIFDLIADAHVETQKKAN